MTHEIFPVSCPSCGESQNLLPGDFEPNAQPFGPVFCMVCQREFSQKEYNKGLIERHTYHQNLTGPDAKN